MAHHTPRQPWLRAVEDPSPESSPARRELSDEELIEAVVGGDVRVAAAIHDRLIGVIDQSLYRVMGRREHDHDDLVQSCFEQVLRTLARRAFAGNCSLRTWAARISTNVALNALRSRTRERKVIDRNEDYDGLHVGSPSTQATRLELDRVQKVLVGMSPAKAEVLILHDVQGYNLNEIAVMLQITVAAAQSRLVRGRKDFRERFERFERRRP